MKDKFYFLLYRLGERSLVKQIYLFYYAMARVTVQLILKLLPFVDSVYLKGSYLKEYFVPVVSDLDFFIVGKKNKGNEKILQIIFSIIHIPFPIVSDFDFHDHEEAEWLAKFGDIKFLEAQNWWALKGPTFKFQYRYHPRKFYLDVVHGIYFQMEWLFKNLRNRKRGEDFASLTIQRQYEKIKDLLNYLHDHSSYTIRKRHFRHKPRWSDYSNEEIIEKFNGLLSKSIKLRQLRKIILREFKGRNSDEVLLQDYYKENLVLIDKEFTYSGRNHYFTRELFELFYYAGCIDSYLLYDWSQTSKDFMGGYFVDSLYFSKLIEGRSNTRHSYQFYLQEKGDLKGKGDYIAGIFAAYESPPPNYFDKDLVIIPYEEHRGDYDSEIIKNELREDFGIDLSILQVSLSSGLKTPELYKSMQIGESIYEISALQVFEKYFDPHIAHVNNLITLGISWAFGANRVLISDRDIILTDELIEKFIKLEFKTPYRMYFSDSDPHRLLLSGLKLNLERIQFDRICNFELYNQDIFNLLITGDLNNKREVYPLDIADLILNKKNEIIRDIKLELRIDNKNYLCAQTLYPLVKNMLIQTQGHFWSIKEEDLPLWHQFGYLMVENNSYGLTDLFSKNKAPFLKLKEIYSANAKLVLEKEALAVIEEDDDKSFSIRGITEGDVSFSKKFSVLSEKSDFQLLRLNIEFKDYKMVDYIDFHIASLGYEQSGMKVQKRNFKPSFVEVIVFIPEGSQSITFSGTLYLRQGMKVVFNLSNPKEFSINAIANSNQDAFTKMIPANAIFCCDLELFHLEDKNKAYIFDNDVEYPTHIDLKNNKIRCYGILKSERQLGEVLSLNFSKDLIKSITLGSILSQWDYLEKVVSHNEFQIVRMKNAPNSSFEFIYRLDKKYEPDDYLIQFTYFSDISEDSPVEIKVEPDYNHDQGSVTVINDDKVRVLPVKLDTYKNFIKFEFHFPENRSDFGFRVDQIIKVPPPPPPPPPPEKKTEFIVSKNELNENNYVFEYILDKKYPYGFYEVDFTYFNEIKEGDEFKLELSLNDSEEVIAGASIGRDLRKLVCRLDEYQEKINFYFSFLRDREKYGFRVDKISNLEFEKLNFDYIDGFELPNKLTKTYIGNYKLVIYLKEDSSGDIWLENSEFKYPSIKIEDEKMAVYYFHSLQEHRNLKLKTPGSIEKVDLLFSPQEN